jgi:F-type H+-transporting ATPase subunit gamma
MAGSKEIRTKIKSVQNTRKITKAMEMVAASKMRKAQDRMRRARPYADKVRNIVGHLASANPEYQHPFLVDHDTVKAAGLIVVTTDKGLCGGLNTNLLRAVTNKLRELEAAGEKILVTAIGNKGLGFFNRVGAQVVSHVTQLGDTPHLEKLIGPVKVQLDAYTRGEIDRVFLCYTRFINTMKQESVIEQLLPLSAERMQEDRHEYSWDYLYEPDAQSVLDDLLVRYVEALVYQAVAENMASEQSARMVAMKAASDNAKKVIDDLQLSYNKARQAAITKELSEIVSGAAAV